MKKIEKDGKVAVLVSYGFGAGWSSWNREHEELLCMDAEIVQAVLDGDKKLAAEIAERKTSEYVCTLGINDVEVVWVEKGSCFEIEEYDGSETLHVIGTRVYMVA